MHTVYCHPLIYSDTHSLKSTSTQSHSSPTFLYTDTGNIPGYFAHVGGVVGEFIFEAFQGHSVAMWTELLDRAFGFEFILCGRTGHICVNESFFGSRGPRELIAVDLIFLGLDQAIYSQVLVIFNTYSDLLASCWDQQHWGNTQTGA